MTGAWAIAKKDLSSHWRSWVGVLSTATFLLIAGIFFTVFLFAYSQISFEAARQAYEGIEGLNLTVFVMGTFLLNLAILLLFLAPLFSMRSFAEERRFGTLELLYTYPLSDFEMVFGKYLALLAKFGLLLLPTLSYPVALWILGAKVDGGVFLTGLLGVFLLAAAFLGIGLFFSSLTDNQMLAGGLTFAVLAGFWAGEWFTGFFAAPWDRRIAALSPFVHFRDFSLGIIDLKDLTYFLCVIALFFFLTLRVVETRNWKG
jgi:ABC-2 type transport system permease protein